MNRLLKASLLFVATLSLFVSSVVDAKLYRYKDESGHTVISNTVPPKASVRGYDVIDDKGRVIDTVAPAPTQDELDQRAAKEQRQLDQARQQAADTKLLRRFSTPDDAVRAMHRKLQQLQSLSQLKRGNIAVIVNQLDEERSRAANLERSGRDIPDTTLEKIDRLQDQIRDIEHEIAIQKADIASVKEHFESDIRRLETLTGKTRTIPLEQPASDDRASQ